MKSTNMLAMTLLLLTMVAVASHAASGEVIYTAVNKTLSGNGSIGMDLDQNGIRDFTLLAASHVTSCGLRGGLIGSVKISPPVGNAVVATHLNFAALLPSGTRIKFQKLPYIVDQFVCPSSHHVEGFLGLEFQINGQTHFSDSTVLRCVAVIRQVLLVDARGDQRSNHRENKDEPNIQTSTLPNPFPSMNTCL